MRFLQTPIGVAVMLRDDPDLYNDCAPLAKFETGVARSNAAPHEMPAGGDSLTASESSKPD